MNTSRSRQHGFAHIFVIIIVVVILAALGWVAWKQFGKTDSNVATNGTDNMVTFKTPINAQKQGDCHLSIKDSSGKEVISQDNSTKGKSGQTGCEEWKLDRTKLPEHYAATVTFDDGNDKLTQTVLLPTQR